MFIRGHGEAQLHPAHRAPITNVDATHLTGGGRWWQRGGHAAQHAEPHLPDTPHQYEADRHPDDRSKHVGVLPT